MTTKQKLHCKAIVNAYHGITAEGGHCCFMWALEGSDFCKRHQNYTGKLNGRTD